MSEQTPENTSTETTPEPAAKKGSKKLIIIILAVLLIGGGGGGAYYFTRSSDTDEAEKEAKTEKKSKAESADEEPEEEEESAKTSSKSSKSLKSALPKDEDVKHIIELQPFIVNLADTEQARYLRMSVSLGIGGEAAESEKPDPLFMTRVRNAMLAVLSDKNSEEILSAEGKAKLRKDLLRAAQAAAEEPEVQAIYITDFIVQL